MLVKSGICECSCITCLLHIYSVTYQNEEYTRINEVKRLKIIYYEAKAKLILKTII